MPLSTGDKLGPHELLAPIGASGEEAAAVAPVAVELNWQAGLKK